MCWLQQRAAGIKSVYLSVSLPGCLISFRHVHWRKVSPLRRRQGRYATDKPNLFPLCAADEPDMFVQSATLGSAAATYLLRDGQWEAGVKVAPTALAR